MKKQILILMLLCALLFALSGCTSGTASNTEEAPNTVAHSSQDREEGSFTIVDHNGNEVTLPETIDRVVVTDIYPLASVLALFFDSAEKLVGIHKVSMAAAENALLGELYPKLLQAETGFMEGSDLNLEELAKLDPDVVFYNAANAELGEKLDQAGFAAVAVSTSKWDYDVLETYKQWIALLSQIFPANDKSGAAADYAAQIYGLVQERVADLGEEERAKVLFLFQYDDEQIVTSGKHFFGQWWCDAVGAVNVAEEIEIDNSNAVINMEQAYAWNPAIVFLTNFTATQPEDLYQSGGSRDWSQICAVQEKQVYKMPLGMYRSYTPGADTPITLLWLAKRVYPARFEDIDLTEAAKTYYKTIFDVDLSDEQIDRIFSPATEVGAAADCV